MGEKFLGPLWECKVIRKIPERVAGTKNKSIVSQDRGRLWLKCDNCYAKWYQALGGAVKNKVREKKFDTRPALTYFKRKKQVVGWEAKTRKDWDIKSQKNQNTWNQSTVDAGDNQKQLTNTEPALRLSSQRGPI